MNFEQPQIEKLLDRANPRPPLDVFELGYVAPFSTDFAKPAEPASETKPETDAVPPVIEPPERDLAAEALELCAPVLDYLQEFVIVEPVNTFELGYTNPLATDFQKPAVSTEQKNFERRKAALLADLKAWADSLRGFLENHRNWRLAALRNEHAEAWRAVRSQKALVDRLADEGSQALGRKRQLITARSQSRVAFETHDAAKPHPDSVPSQGDLDRWQGENSRLKAAFVLDNQAVEAEMDRQRDLARKLAAEGTKLATLRARERKLRGKLSGREVNVMGLSEL